MITILSNGVRFHNDHYSKVDRERERRGMAHNGTKNGPEGNRIYGHPLEGQRIIFRAGRSKAYIVETVHKHWYYGGWYIHVVARVEDTKSHTIFWVENINSTHPFILESIEEFNRTFMFDRVRSSLANNSIVHASKNGTSLCGKKMIEPKLSPDKQVNCDRCKRILTSSDRYVE